MPGHLVLVLRSAASDEEWIEEIDLWFRERGRKLILKEVPGGWLGIYAVHIPNVAVNAPAGFGETRAHAAESAVAEYLAAPNLIANDRDPTPPQRPK